MMGESAGIKDRESDPNMGLAGSKAGVSVTSAKEGDFGYYAVYIPNSGEEGFLHVYEDQVDALIVVKRHKKARFKRFTHRSHAVEFAVRGPDSVPDEGLNAAPRDVEKPSLFKGPKREDMLQLRRAIESGNIDLVCKTVWDNPRFLVSSGDTPSILQEGSRYNAMHVAAKSKNAAMADFILQTVGNPEFLRLLYGEESLSSVKLGSAAERSAILLDLYLNTPDKGMHETPLHFAAKFGVLQVVSILVSYPECDREPKNKFGQRPIDIVCARCTNASSELKSQITSLLLNDYYVPVLRADDNSIQPVIGTPFSPKDPPLFSEDLLSPRLEIRAFAGPMSQSEATDFHRLWRTPTRAQGNTSFNALNNEPKSCSSMFRLVDPQKGLERVGRDLAANQCIPWKEFWPFLNTFTDLSSPEGLSLLEEYLSKQYQSVDIVQKDSGRSDDLKASYLPDDSIEGIKVKHTLDGTDTEPEVVSPVTQLCSMMNACTILDDSIGSGLGRGSPLSLPFSPSPATSPSNGSILSSSASFFNWLSRRRPDSEKNVPDNNQNEAILAALSNPTVSPFLYVEKSLQLFAKRIAASLHHLISGSATNHLSDSIRDVLKPEVKRVQSLVCSYMEDARFVAVDYHLVHSRVASSVAERLVDLLTWEEREVLYGSLQDMLSAKGNVDGSLSSDDDDVITSSSAYRQPRPSRQSANSNQKTAIRCIGSQMVWALDQLQGSGPDGRSPLPPRPQVRTENECLEMWSDAYLCLCPWPSNGQTNFARGSRKTSSLKRSMNNSHCLDSQNISRRLEYDEKDGMLEPEDVCIETDHSDDGNEIFFTPPSSPCGSPVPFENSKMLAAAFDDDDDDDDMDVPDEGVAVFLEGCEPSKLDADVVNALMTCSITQSSHPHIYRWRHEVLLHPVEERKRWPTRKGRHSSSPSSSSVPSTPHFISTPVRSGKVGQPIEPSPAWSRITGVYSPLPNNAVKK